MAQTYTTSATNVSCCKDTNPNTLRYNYVELESTITDMGDYINFSYWMHWHEPYGYNCWGISYLWLVRFYDKNGNAIPNADLNITHTNVAGYAARLFCYPTKTSPPAECVLDRYTADSTPARTNLYSFTGLAYSTESSRVAGHTQLRDYSSCPQYLKDNMSTRMTWGISKADIPANAYAYGNVVIFAQYLDNRAPHPVQDPMDSDNQFATYVFPAGNVAIEDPGLIIDSSSKVYHKSGSTWQDKARIYHKENGSWEKKYLYHKENGTWKKV